MSWIEALIKLPEPEPPEPPEPPGPIGIFGVYWDGTSTTQWTRTDDAVGFEDPVSYYRNMTDTPSSPFDNIQPWSGMRITEDATVGSLVSIPKFWYKITQNSSTHDLKIQIANTETEGFNVSPAHMDRGDGNGERNVIYVGRYHCAPNTYKSTTGTDPKTGASRSVFRSYIHNLGSTIWQWDFATRFTIWLLYLVEFANWNSQTSIGVGCGNNSSTEPTGYTDNMGYHTGTTALSKSSPGGIQYRYIEGLWDNVWDFIDGCYHNSSGLNIILNPSSFSDSSGGTAVGIPIWDYPSQFTLKSVSGTYPLFIPTVGRGSASTYSCDYWIYDSSSPCLYAGGYYYQSLYFGLFYIGAGPVGKSEFFLGSRLMKLPNS